MEHTQKWAIQQWEKTTKKKLKEGKVGTKLWWNIVKDKQGNTKDETIPPLITKDGTLAVSSEEKTDALARHFSSKMTVPYPEQKPPTLPILSNEKLSRITTSEREVEKLLRNVDTRKATGPDGVNPRLLQRCAKELSSPLTLIFNTCLSSCKWPTLWKQSNVVPIFKKGDKSSPKTYQLISLLSIISKLFEKKNLPA